MDFTVRDQDHINILAVCYLVFGVLGIITSIGIGLYFGFMGAMMKQITNEAGAGAGDMPELEMLGNLPGLMIGIGVIMVVLGIIGAIMKLVTGFLMKKRKGYMFCLATAGLTCLSLPLGTILGVFTFVVLMRQQVARAFRTGEPAVQPVYAHPGQVQTYQQPQAPYEPPPGA